MTIDANHDRSADETMPNGSSSRLLTIAETCDALSLSRSMIYRLIASSDLEAVHIGRSIRIPADAVDLFVERLRLRTRAG